MPTGISPLDFRALLFDVDGTLVDSIGGLVEGLHDAFQRYGSRPFCREEIRGMIGVPLRQQMLAAIGPHADEASILEAIDYTLDRYQFHNAGHRLFEPAVEALRLAHRNGWATALVTSKNALEMERFLPGFAARDSIGCAVCASDVPAPKPAPDCVRLACTRLGVEPSEAAMIGDSIYDLRSARAAGAAAIAVGYGSTPEPVLMAEGPDAIFATPDDLLAWIQEAISYRHEKKTDRYIERTG